ncbi:MAG: hypothetical protein A2140_08080 [Candidatus Muproteobacteria bacterium RBG_16_62_13]|uniref:Uncharacterized protein n=1 Tax=Candidatus Muproteobacteria bacterium RBG_16_62_13 TaxID=1817756 RepID=A0A1F6T7Y3_9PROT|nr:MAG: hypothetical protein A2140_08080 [Candidatus Muproteobacteria bacterium RBG_16_62_13]
MHFTMSWVAGILISIVVRIWWSLMGRMILGFTPEQMNSYSLMPAPTGTQLSLSIPNGTAHRAKMLFCIVCSDI